MDLMIEDLMEQLVEGGGSDLHIASGHHKVVHQFRSQGDFTQEIERASFAVGQRHAELHRAVFDHPVAFGVVGAVGRGGGDPGDPARDALRSRGRS